MSPTHRTMRVLYIEPVGGHRGLDFYDLTLCRGLVNCGISPVLITCEPSDLSALVQPVQVHYPFHNIYGKAPLLIRGLRYVLGLLWIAAFGAWVKGQVVHYHFPQVPLADWLLLQWLKRFLGYRFVMTVHDVLPLDQSSRLDRFFLRRLYHLADAIIVHAEASRRELLQLIHIPAERITLVPITSALAFWDRRCPTRAAAREQLHLSPDAQVILFFGQIKRTKGLEYLLQALPRVVAHCPQALLVIAGPQGDVPIDEYRRRIQQLCLDEHIELRIGYVPDTELPSYFLSADVVVLPYTRVYQSAVLTLAQSFGAPIVASDIGGLSEILQDGETGWLVKPGDSAELAGAITRVLENPVRAAEVGLRGHEGLLQNASPEQVAQQTAQVYRQALSGSR